MPSSASSVEAATRAWLERAVIGLNLCPFAKAVHVKGLVHYAVSSAVGEEALLDDLAAELTALAETVAEVRDTTLIVVPDMLQDFLDYNDFLGLAEDKLVSLGLDGQIQIASFHPHYQFAGTAEDDITNYTNRAPYPILHLLREDSIDKAVASFPDAEEIFGRNMQTLEALGHEGWAALNVDAPATGDDGRADVASSRP